MSNNEDLLVIGMLQEDNQRLLQENDRLRAELLKAPDANMIAFIAEWELWVGRYQIFNSDDNTQDIFEDMRLKYNELKANHGLAKDGE